MRKYSFISKIGQGAYGAVVKAKINETGQIVAIKRILLKPDEKSQLEVIREISTLKNVEHENIITLLSTNFSSSTASLIMEYVESNLKLVINDEMRPLKLSNHYAKFYFRQILLGIKYLHGLNIMHRDLKPENILISLKNEVKIGDFGLACLYFPADKDRTYSHQVATRWYRAPELLFGAVRYDPRVDIWAIG
uniref:Protein kinase domain-containing protein n=1 Tax=Acrobeloides nanus TaxID=290746 RepID=A0A914EDZ4_9BILA